jgi:acyl-CoA synthetase (NDP forming)
MSQQYHVQSAKIRAKSETPVYQVDRKKADGIISAAGKEERDLLISEAIQVLDCYGIATAHSVIAKTVEEAQAAAEAIGYPVAMKIVAEQISHKSDVGGVQLNLRNAPMVAEAFEEMMKSIHQAYPDAELDGVLVQPMASGGRELILGGRHDPQFGPVVLAGLGGIFVEIFEESQVRVAPLSKQIAQEMLENLRGYQILAGARGHKAVDIEAVVETLLRLSQLLVDFPEIEELDINPLRVFPAGEGCSALDARIILGGGV